MKPSEKAKELLDLFIEPTKVPNIKMVWVEYLNAAKMCALMCVDEIISSVEYGHEHEWFFFREEENDFLEYWNEVKSEIEKM